MEILLLSWSYFDIPHVANHCIEKSVVHSIYFHPHEIMSLFLMDLSSS